MSTKAIRKALESMRGIALTRDQSQARVEAMAEVEAIEKACVTLYQYGVVHNEFGEEHETTPALDKAADHLMVIGLTRLGMERQS